MTQIIHTLRAQMDSAVVRTLLAIAVFLLACNVIFPIQSDDLGAIGGGLQAALNAYNQWNARWGELLLAAYISTIVPTWYFALINAFVGFGVIVGFFVFLFGRLPRARNDTKSSNGSDALLLCVLMIIIWLYAAFGSIFIWGAGALNYLWAYLALLWSFIPYRLYWGRYFAGKRGAELYRSSSAWLEILKAIGFMFLCFIAGMGSEMVGIVAILVHGGFLLYGFYMYKRDRIALPLWYYAGFIALACGWLALYFAPGPAKRGKLFQELYGKDAFYTLGDILAMSFKEKLLLLNGVYGRFINLSQLLLIVPLVFVLFERYKSGVKKRYITLIVLGVIAFFVFHKHHHKILPNLAYINLFYYVALFGFFGFMAWFYSEKNTRFSTINHSINHSASTYFTSRKKVFHRLFLYTFLATLLFCLFAGTTIQVSIPERSRFCFVLVGAGVIMLWLKELYAIMEDNARKRCATSIVAATMLCGAFVLAAFIDGRIKWENMVQSIEKQKQQSQNPQNEVIVIIPASTFKSFYGQYGDWVNPGDNPNQWPNTTYAKHFGVKQFITQ